MAYRNGNYTAFYVEEPFSPLNLAAFATPDFCYYMQLKMWKVQDPSFPFVNSHDKTYNVRDGSDWERTLKPRLRERLRCSKNIILFLSTRTRASRALSEEIDYGVGELGLPLIIVYPDFDPILSGGHFDERVHGLWSAVPALTRCMNEVPTVHIPNEKASITAALSDFGYTVQGKYKPGTYRLP